MTNILPPIDAAAQDDDRSTRRFGYGVALTVITILFIWGGYAPLQSAAIAPGVVQVEGKRKPVQHLEGGIISQILVANGEMVEKDQILMTLDAARDRAERDILQGRLYNLAATADRLEAEREDLPQVSFRAYLVEASAEDARARNAISSELALFLARSNDRRAETEVLASQKKGFELVLRSKLSVEDSLGQEIDDLQELLIEGYVDKQRLRQLERSRAQVLGEIADLQVAIEEVSLRVSQARKRFKMEVIDELASALEDLYDIEQRHAAAEDRVRRATIRAPTAGVILNLKHNTVGAVIGSGETLLEIVPRIDELVIEARISPMDIDRVHVGQSAEVLFAVFKDAYRVSGTLTKLSPDRLIDADMQLPYYSAEVKLLEEDLRLLEGRTLVPGMPAEVLVQTHERTMLGYLTSPMNRLFARSLTED